MSQQIDAQAYCDHVWMRMTRQTDEYDEALFEQEYQLLERDLNGETFSVRIIAPIEGFYTDARIPLSNDLAIEELDELDIAKYLDMQPPLDGPLLGRRRIGPPKYSLIHRTRIKKELGIRSSGVPQALLDTIERAITALCIFRKGSFQIPSIFITSDSILHPGIMRVGQPGAYWHRYPSLTLEGDAATEFASFYGALSGALDKNKTAFGVAPRRFRYAAQRERGEDMLLDLLIAAEALFLPQKTTELSYQFALRGAVLLGATPEERHSTFKKMRNAYDIRSRLVHGGTPNYPKHPGEVRRKTAEEYVLEVESDLRAGLGKIIELVNNRDGWDNGKSWETLIFGSRDPEDRG